MPDPMDRQDSIQYATPPSEAPSEPIFVAEVMTRDIVTLGPERTYADAVALMASRFFRHLVVIDEHENLHGVVSDRDILRALANTPNWKAKSISEIMTREVFTIAADARVSTAIRDMLTNRINCLPVIGADGRVCGIVTSTDLLRAYEEVQRTLERHALPAPEQDNQANGLLKEA